MKDLCLFILDVFIDKFVKMEKNLKEEMITKFVEGAAMQDLIREYDIGENGIAGLKAYSELQDRMKRASFCLQSKIILDHRRTR